MTSDSLIYLDNNATTRPDPAVVAAMMPYWQESYFNPASVVGELVGTSKPIQDARKSLAALLGADPNEFYLTSGATESNNWVLQTIALESAQKNQKCRILVSAIEHPSILETVAALRKWKHVECETIPVLENGQIDLTALKNLITTDTALVSIMLANNESGVIQPLSKACDLIKKSAPNCTIHTDATQAVGKIPVSLDDLLHNVDLLSLSAHKFHGPKGIGALFIRRGTSITPWFHGGSQQNGKRAGTENPALAAGMAEAAELAAKNLSETAFQMEMLRASFEESLRHNQPEIRVLGSDSPRLPNTTLLLFPNEEGEMLVHILLEHGIATSTGSACSNGNDQPSHVVTAMGVPYQLARNALRISLSRETTPPQIARLTEIIGLF